MFAVFLVVLGGPGPPGGSPETPGMLFQPKAPMGLGPIDDPPILVAIRDILIFMFFWGLVGDCLWVVVSLTPT